MKYMRHAAFDAKRSLPGIYRRLRRGSQPNGEPHRQVRVVDPEQEREPNCLLTHLVPGLFLDRRADVSKQSPEAVMRQQSFAALKACIEISEGVLHRGRISAKFDGVLQASHGGSRRCQA